MTAMSEAMVDAVAESGRQLERARDLVRAVRAHKYAVETPPNGDVNDGLGAVMTLDRMTAIANDLGEDLGMGESKTVTLREPAHEEGV